MRKVQRVWTIIVLCGVALSSFSDFRKLRPGTFEVEISVFEKEVLEGKIDSLSAFLVVSGISHAQFPRYQKQYQTLLADFKKISRKWSGYEKADQLLQFLHKSVFKQYQEKVTTMDRLFDQGIYNCVTSSVLYNLMAEDSGLKVRAAQLSDYVLSQVEVGEKWIDAETTVAFGFDPGNRRAALDKFKQITGYVYVPSSKAGRKVHLISTRELAALLYSNRGVNTLEQKEYVRALGFFWKALWILPDFEQGQQNLEAGYTELAISQMKAKQFQQAEENLLELLRLVPASAKTPGNLKAVNQAWLNDFFERGQYEQGIAMIQRKKTIFNSADLNLYYKLWIQDLVNRKRDFPAALGVMEKARKLFPEDRELVNNRVYILEQYYLSAVNQKQEKKAQEVFENYQNEKEMVTFFAVELSKAGKKNLAREYLQKKLQSDKNDDWAKLVFNLVYEAISRGDLKEMEDGLLFLAEQGDKYAFIRGNLGNLFQDTGRYFYQNDKLEEGKAFLRKISRQKALESVALKTLGMLFYQVKIYPLLKKKELDKALPLLKEAMILSEGHYPTLAVEYKNIRINQGAVFFQEKKYKEAFYHYAALIKEYPREGNVINNLKASGQMYLRSLPPGGAEAQKVKKILEGI